MITIASALGPTKDLEQVSRTGARGVAKWSTLRFGRTPRDQTASFGMWSLSIDPGRPKQT